MTDLVFQESERIRSDRESFMNEKRRRNEKRFRSALWGAAIGGIEAAALYWPDKNLDLNEFLECAVTGFILYEAFSSNLTYWGTELKDYLNPKNYTKLGKIIAKGGNEGIIEAEKDLIADSQDEILERGAVISRNVDAYSKLLEGRKDEGLNGLRDIYDESGKSVHKPNLLVTAVLGGIYGISSIIPKSYDRNLLYSASCASLGWNKLSEMFLDNALFSCRDRDQSLDVFCMMGSFLESRGREEESRYIFNRAVNLIDIIDDTEFKRVPGSTNLVYVHDSKLLGDTFVFKTGEGDDVLREYEKDRSVSYISGDRKHNFVFPIGVVEKNRRTFAVTRRRGKFSLGDYIRAGLNERAFDVIGKTLDEIVLLQANAKEKIKDCEKLFGNVNLKRLAYRKFLRFHDNLSSCPNQYGDILNGINFVCGEIDRSYKSLAHNDLHPENIIIDSQGGICLIDWEKAGITSPHIDAITLVENYRTREISDVKQRNEMVRRYCENMVDSGVIDSLEDSERNNHLAGVFQHLVLCQSPSFASIEELGSVEAHHRSLCLWHLGELEGIYAGGELKTIKMLRKRLEDCLSNA